MDTEWNSSVKSLDFPRVGQLGFVVNDIEASISSYASFYNVDKWFEPIYVEKVFQIGGEKVELDLRLLFAFSGGLQLELIQTGSQIPHLYAQHLERYGEGLHHLGFFISNFDQRMQMVESIGIPVLLQGSFRTAGGGRARFAYLDTQQYCGVIMEFIEVKLYGISLPQREFTWNIGALTGDAEIIRI